MKINLHWTDYFKETSNVLFNTHYNEEVFRIKWHYGMYVVGLTDFKYFKDVSDDNFRHPRCSPIRGLQNVLRITIIQFVHILITTHNSIIMRNVSNKTIGVMANSGVISRLGSFFLQISLLVQISIIHSCSFTAYCSSIRVS